MKPGARCEICEAPLRLQITRTPLGTAKLAVCSRWAVHPLVCFGLFKKPGVPGAPAKGVLRV